MAGFVQTPRFPGWGVRPGFLVQVVRPVSLPFSRFPSFQSSRFRLLSRFPGLGCSRGIIPESRWACFSRFPSFPGFPVSRLICFSQFPGLCVSRFLIASCGLPAVFFLDACVSSRSYFLIFHSPGLFFLPVSRSVWAFLGSPIGECITPHRDPNFVIRGRRFTNCLPVSRFQARGPSPG